MPAIIRNVVVRKTLSQLWEDEDMARHRARPMMERTTEAIYQRLAGSYPCRRGFENAGQDALKDTVLLAYAVMRELIEPTPEMCQAGSQALAEGSDARGIFRRMMWKADDWRPAP